MHRHTDKSKVFEPVRDVVTSNDRLADDRRAARRRRPDPDANRDSGNYSERSSSTTELPTAEREEDKRRVVRNSSTSCMSDASIQVDINYRDDEEASVTSVDVLKVNQTREFVLGFVLNTLFHATDRFIFY